MATARTLLCTRRVAPTISRQMTSSRFQQPLVLGTISSASKQWKQVEAKGFSTSVRISQSAQAATVEKQLKHANLRVDNGVAIITLDSPGVKMNSLNEEVMRDMEAIFNEVQSRSDVRAAVLISGKVGCFIAGADINMIEACKSASEAQELSKSCQEFLFRIEQSSKPIVAAIQGPCLGGGLETAMACHFRVAVDGMKTSLGVPEVMLGLLPGGGGTQRLPKLVGLPTALDMALTGKMLNAKRAKKAGLVDLVVDYLGAGLGPADTTTRNYLENVAVDVARDLADGKMKKPSREPKTLVDKVTKWALGFDYTKDYVFNTAKGKVMKMTSGLYPAPLKILEVVRAGLDKPEAEGYKAEHEGFGQLAATSESKALISLFHGQTECKKNKFGKPAKRPQYEF